MDRFVNHDEVVEALGAYALDAVETDEADAIRRHLEVCPRCAEEVAQHHQVAALLGNTGGDAPTHLWNEIAGELARPSDTGVLRSLPVVGADAPRPGDRRARGGMPGTLRRPWWLAAAAAAAVVIALLSLQVVHLNNRVGSLNALGGNAGIERLAHSALANPQAQTVDLVGPHGRGTAVQVVVLPSGSAYLINKTLPALPTDETYQLWGRSSGRLISLGVLGSGPATVAFTVGHPDSYDAYMVTAERAGGVVQTTHTPVAEGTVLSA